MVSFLTGHTLPPKNWTKCLPLNKLTLFWTMMVMMMIMMIVVLEKNKIRKSLCQSKELNPLKPRRNLLMTRQLPNKMPTTAKKKQNWINLQEHTTTRTALDNSKTQTKKEQLVLTLEESTITLSRRKRWVPSLLTRKQHRNHSTTSMLTMRTIHQSTQNPLSRPSLMVAITSTTTKNERKFTWVLYFERIKLYLRKSDK